MPEYAHLPLIVDAESRAKLSKRHGAVALEDFRHDGYLPEALMNYIALLGWAPADDGDEVLDADALVAAFDLDRVHARRRRLRPGEARLAERRVDPSARRSTSSSARVEPLARARFGDAYDVDVSSMQRSAIAQERAVTLVQIVDQMGFLFVDEADFRIAPESWEVVERTDRIGEVLDAVITHVEGCDWAVDAVDFRGALTALGLSKKEIRTAMPALYAAVEGRPRGLPLFDSMQLLGRDRTLARLRAARARLTGA